MTKDIIQIVEKANLIDTDYRGRVKSILCLSCKNGCVDFEFTLNGMCKNYVHRLSLNEIKDEIKKQNINISKLCKQYNLKYRTMRDMLNNKLALSYKYYMALELRIMEKSDYDIYVERFNNGE